MTTLDPAVTRAIAPALVLLVLACLVLYVRRRRAVARALGDPWLVRRLVGTDLAAVPWLRMSLVGLASIFVALALLDPALASTRTAARGPVVLLLDASGSMLVEEAGRSRIDAQRDVARTLVAAVPDVPIGVVAFAGRAFSLTPPTRDRGSVEMYLATLHPTIVTQSGSALGAAVRQGIGLLTAEERSRGGTLILLSDGDETEDLDAAFDAARLAARAGIRVHAVGFGTAIGAPVPALDLTTGEASGYLQDPAGQVLVSRRGDELLAGIARLGGGTYSRAEDPRIVPTLAELVGGGTPPEEEPRTLPRYLFLTAAALACLLLEPIAVRIRRAE